MSETARTLVRSAMRVSGWLAAGETPSATDENDAYSAFKFMLRSWSSKNIRIPYSTTESISLDGSASYTWGSGGTISTTRPEVIRGGYIANIGQLKIVGEDRMRRFKAASTTGGYTEALHYVPSYPLGVLYAWPLASDTIIVDTLKELSEPATLTADVTFPKGYDDAIKWNLAVRLCAEIGREPTQTVRDLAVSTMDDIETRNFANAINEATLEILSMSRRYNIDAG